MKRNIITVVVLGIIVKIIGFSRDLILSFYYGASNLTDVYMIATTIPLVVFSFIGAGIVTSFIPVYSTIISDKDKLSFLNNIINLVILLTTIIVLTIYIFSEEIVELFVPGFNSDSTNLAIKFTQISCLGLYFSGVIFILQSYLESNGKFFATSLMSLPLNVVLILSIILSSIYSVDLLAWGILISVFCQFLFLTPFVKKTDYKYSFKFNFKDKYVKKMVILAVPASIGVSMDQINLIIDRSIASNIMQGGISALSYSNKLIIFIQSILIVSLITVVFPKISSMVSVNKFKEFNSTIYKFIEIFYVIIFPVTLLLIFYSKSIIEILYGRGEFDSYAVEITFPTLSLYGIGLIGIALRELLSKAFFALHDTKTPVLNAVIGMILNIILNLILSNYMGINGLALATSVSTIITGILLIFSLEKKNIGFRIKNTFLTLYKTTLSVAIMFIALLITTNNLEVIDNDILQKIINVTLSICIYFISLYLIKEKTIRNLISFKI